MRWKMIVPVVALLGCGPDPELVAQRDELANKVNELEKERSRLEREADRLHAQVRKLTEQVEHLQLRETLSQLGMTEDQKLGAVFVTTKGDIRCELWPDKAPRTVLNFVQLAEGKKEWTDPRTKQKTRRPLYDGTIFHRVIPEFMIQGGDPLGTGAGGPGYEFADETSPALTFSEPGLLAMANRGPDTNGSQFFVTDRSTPEKLNGKHTIFGRCADAQVVQAIASVETGANNKPRQDVVLRTVRITRQ